MKKLGNVLVWYLKLYDSMLDTHCHIDLYPDPYIVAREIERRRILTIAVTNLPSHFEIGQPHLLRFRQIRQALGLHPLMAEHHKKERPKFKQLLSKTSYIGEIGLDFSKEGRDTKDIQIESLRFVFKEIQDRPRFVSLHSRGAESKVLELLEEFNIQSAVFHWYSGPLTVLDQAVRAGHYFSVNPAMVRSKTGRIIIDRIPLDRILTESDGPHIHLKSQPVRPSNIKGILEVLGDIWGVSFQEADRQVWANFMKLLVPIREQAP